MSRGAVQAFATFVWPTETALSFHARFPVLSALIQVHGSFVHKLVQVCGISGDACAGDSGHKKRPVDCNFRNRRLYNIQGNRETVAQCWTASDTSVPWDHKAFHRSCAASSTSFCRHLDGVPECPNRLRALWGAVHLGHVHSTLLPLELQSDGLAIPTAPQGTIHRRYSSSGSDHSPHIAYILTIKEPAQ
ncbi:hypothetical protein B0H19DRAFT_1374221 [Mycena capillaripes]|nr:hypothetical protein B0H19DRAFT_1374221 [Mycena capillaripes]